MATWEIKNDILYYYGTNGGNTVLFSIAGLQNLPTVDESTTDIDYITVSGNEVKIQNYFNEDAETTINGAGYTFRIDYKTAAKIKVTSANTTVRGNDRDADYSVTAEGFNGKGEFYGDNVNNVLSAKNVTVSGTLELDGYSGDDSISADGVTVANDGKLTLQGAQGTDTVDAKNISVDGGEVGIYGHSGNDSVSVQNVTLTSGGVNISDASGTDTISVDGVTMAGGNFSITGNEDADTISVANVSVNGGYFKIFDPNSNDDDKISVSKVTVDGSANFDIDARAGNDTISVSEVSLKNVLHIYGADGNDSISVSKVTVDGTATFDIAGNAGADTISVESVQAERAFTVKSDNTDGTDSDKIIVKDSSGIRIYSGGGTDTLVFGGNVTARINDFSADDVISLESAVNPYYVTFTQGSSNSTLQLGENISLQLDNVTDISSYGEVKIYNGETEKTLSEFLAENAWHIDTDGVVYYGKSNGTYDIKISGLQSPQMNAEGTAVDGISFDDYNQLTIADSLIGDSEIEIETSKKLNFTENKKAVKFKVKNLDGAVTIFGSNNNDTITADGATVEGSEQIFIYGEVGADSVTAGKISVKDSGRFQLTGDEGADTISVDSVTVEGGNLAIGGNDDSDKVTAKNITHTGGNVNIYVGEDADTISVVGVTQSGGSDFQINGANGNDSVSAENISVESNNYFQVYGGAGNDTVSVKNVTVTSGNFTVSGGEESSSDKQEADTISVENVSVNGGDFQISGGTAGDLISVKDASNVSIYGDSGADTLVFGGTVTANLDDFDYKEDFIRLTDSVETATFDNGTLTLGNITLTGASPSYKEFKIYNGADATECITAAELFKVPFAYDSSKTYYFDLKDEIEIKPGAKAFDSVESEYKYNYLNATYSDGVLTLTNTFNGLYGAQFAIDDTNTSEVDLTFDSTATDSRYKIKNGTLILDTRPLYTSGGTQINGDCSNLNVVIANGAVTDFIPSGYEGYVNIGGDYYAFTENSVIKSVMTDGDTKTFKEYEKSVNAGETVQISSLTTTGDTTNEYTVNANTVTLTKGSISAGIQKAGITNTDIISLVTSTDGITFTVKNNKIVGVVEDTFSVGESFSIGDTTYTMTGKGVKSGNMIYTGDLAQLISNKLKHQYWTVDSSWKIENDLLIAYTEEDGKQNTLFKIGGLNVKDASTITNEKISVNANAVKILDETLIGNDAIEFDGGETYYGLDLSKIPKAVTVSAKNTNGVIGTSANDSISVKDWQVDRDEYDMPIFMGNAGNDTISVENVTALALCGEDMQGQGTGNDLISVKNSSGVGIMSGGGVDTLEFGGDVTAIIADFDASDVIRLKDSVVSASFDAETNALTLGTNILTLDEITSIENYSNMKVENGAEEEITLNELLNRVEFAFDANTYYFDASGDIKIADGAPAYTSALDAEKTYIKTTYSDNKLTAEVSGTTYTLQVANENAEIDLAYSNSQLQIKNGTAILTTAGSLISSSGGKQISISGIVTENILVTVADGEVTVISKPAAADSVTISLGEPGGNNGTAYHIENGKISKSETEFTTNGSNVKEYEATLGNVTNILGVTFGESVNEYSVVGENTINTITLTKGKFSRHDKVYALVTSTDGVTFALTDNKITGVVADSFKAGESFKVGDVTYTNVGGTIYRSSDNKAYSGEFNALFAENATWKAADYWKLEDGKLNRCDGDTGAKLFGIGGLNLDLTEDEVAYEIDGVSLNNQTVEISSSVVGNSQIEVDGAGYTFQIKNANVKVTHAEKITGTDGGDRITLEAEGIVIDSGAGADRISLSATSKNNTINGGAGNDTIFGNDEENIFVYTDGNDVIKNYKGKISISGGEIEKGEVSGANVILTTSNGKITVEGGADKAITVVDGEGNQSTQIYSAHATYNADQTAMSLSSSASGEIAAPATVIEIDATNSTRSLHIVGNDNNNKITGNNKTSTLEGGAGDDTLIGGDGKNTFVYSAGNDVINDFDASKDKVKLSDVEITKTEIDGSDLIFTTANGTLKITGGAEEKISVESATTQIYTADAIFNTRLTEMTLHSSASGEIAAESKVKSIDATAVENPVTITANANANTIQGGAGANSIFGDAGNDKIFGNDGNDTLNGGAGNDELTGGDGSDLFIYNGGKDIITDFDATEDSLQINGTISNVSLNGADVIFKTNVGNLTVKNAKDAEISVGDKFYFNALAYDSTKTSATLDSRFGGTLQDYDANIKTIDASEGTKAVEIFGNAQNNTILGGKKADSIYGGAGADSIFGGVGNDKLFGEDGNDTLNGGAGNDTFTGDAGADLFIYNGGKDIITDFSAAEDTIQIDGTISNASLSGENMIFKTSVGNLTIAGGIDQEITIGEKIYFNNLTYDLAKTTATVDKKFGGTLQDYDANIKTIDASEGTKAVEIFGNAQNNTILGGKKNDSIYGDAGADSIFGGAGNDKLFGEDGNDTLNGGAGNDTLWGGYGNDTFIGDAGKDIFVYENGNDTITDYTAGQDKIKLVDVEITETEIDGGDLIFTTANGNLTVKDGDGKRITVIDSDGKSTTQIYKATDSANAGWFDEYDNNFVTDEFGLDDITTPVESNFTASKTETFGTSNEFNFENSLVSADDK